MGVRSGGAEAVERFRGWVADHYDVAVAVPPDWAAIGPGETDLPVVDGSLSARADRLFADLADEVFCPSLFERLFRE